MNVFGQEGNIFRLTGHFAQNAVQHFVDGFAAVFALFKQVLITWV